MKAEGFLDKDCKREDWLDSSIEMLKDLPSSAFSLIPCLTNNGDLP
jgi:hypothetical protein